MRLSLRFILPLLLALSVVAWAAQSLFDGLALRWFVRDLDMRTALIASAVDGTVIDLLRRGQSDRTEQFLERLARDERLYAIGVCDSHDTLIYRTRLYPSSVTCVNADSPTFTPGHLLTHRGGLLHLKVESLVDESGETAVRLVLLHDMSFVQRRSEATRRYLFFSSPRSRSSCRS